MDRIKIDFEFETQYGKFADALYFPVDTPPTDEEIETHKQLRLKNWIAVITAPPTQEPAQEPAQEE